jgi:uncharacterized protein
VLRPLAVASNDVFLSQRMIRSLRYRWIFLLCFVLIGAAHADQVVPPLQTRVTDLAALLTPAQRQSLEQDLREFESRRGSQIAVLIVPTTQPDAIEQFSMRVAESWKLGRKGIDDGVLLLIAKDDRDLRLEVGYGLEGVIPDAVAKRVIAEIIVPYFKQGDFYGGIQAGTHRLMRLIEGEALPPPRQRDSSWSGFGDYLPVAFAAVFLVGGALRAMFGRLPGASIAGGVAAFVMWLILSSLGAALVVGIIAFVFTLMGGMGGRFGGLPGGIGGFGTGGGGFGGGGGGFGGGGASGKW